MAPGGIPRCAEVVAPWVGLELEPPGARWGGSNVYQASKFLGKGIYQANSFGLLLTALLHCPLCLGSL